MASPLPGCGENIACLVILVLLPVRNGKPLDTFCTYLNLEHAQGVMHGDRNELIVDSSSITTMVSTDFPGPLYGTG
jgi:hypothetical protein